MYTDEDIQWYWGKYLVYKKRCESSKIEPHHFPSFLRVSFKRNPREKEKI